MGLKRAGHSVDESGDGKDGLWKAENEKYDLLILDIMLPGMDGLEILTSLRAKGVQTHVLLLTARDTVEDRVTGLSSVLIVASIMFCHAEDEKITLDQAPANIQKAIKKLAGSNKIIRVEKANEPDPIRSLTEKADGKKIEYIVKSNGKLDSTEERLTKDELPDAVAKTVDNTVADGEIHGIERVTKDGKVTFEVGYKTAKGDKREAIISSKGKLLKNGADND